MNASFETLVGHMGDAGIYVSARQALDLHKALLAAHWPNGIETPASPLVPIPDPPMIPPGSIGTAFLASDPTPAPEPPKAPRTRRTRAEMEAARAAETTPATAMTAAPASASEGTHDNPPAGAVASDQDEIPFGRWEDTPPEYPAAAPAEPDPGQSADELMRDIDAQTNVADLDAWQTMAAGHLQSLLAMSIGLHGKVTDRFKARRAELEAAERPAPETGLFGDAPRDPRAVADRMKAALGKISTKAEFGKLQVDDKADIEFLIAGSPEIWAEVKAVAMDVFKSLLT